MLRRVHRECSERHRNALVELTESACRAVVGNEKISRTEQLAASARESAKASEGEVKRAIAQGWIIAAEAFLEDDGLDEEEDRRLEVMSARFGLAHEDINANGIHERITKAGVLREVAEGKIPNRIGINGQLPFVFQKGETPIWLFQGVRYFEDRTHHSYEGRSAGVSVRVARGVYLRTSAFRGRRVEHTSRDEIDQGLLAVTAKHLYFGGARKSFRVRHDKVVAFVPFSDGVGLFRDVANAKCQVFQTGDGWFVNNLISSLSQASEP